ncbi:hypothetical protein DK37_28530 [Halomonas sp. SUBG004]|nr:hypothetical protein DK37_28530 [Halomonas sp. SUBG004]
MISATLSPWFGWKRMSRSVTMPTKVSPSTTGKPEKPYSRAMASRSSSLALGLTVTGSLTMTFVLLHLTHFSSLLRHGHVLMDDANAAFLRHGNGETRFGHGVHCSGKQGNVQEEIAGQAGFQADILGQTSEKPGTRSTSSNVSASWAIRSIAATPIEKWEDGAWKVNRPL